MNVNLLSDNPFLSISFTSYDDRWMYFSVTFGNAQVNCKAKIGIPECFILGLDGEETKFFISTPELNFLVSEYNKRKARNG